MKGIIEWLRDARYGARLASDMKVIGCLPVNIRREDMSGLTGVQLLLSVLAIEDLQLRNGAGDATWGQLLYPQPKSRTCQDGFRILRARYSPEVEVEYWIPETVADKLAERCDRHPEWKKGRSVYEGGREYLLERPAVLPPIAIFPVARERVNEQRTQRQRWKRD